jgi:hypothetical protein
MIQFPGPPSVPPVLPFESNEALSRNDPRKAHPRANSGSGTSWTWRAAGRFALLAVLLKLLLLPRFEPSALFAGLAAFLSAAVLWRGLVSSGGTSTTARGALAGGLTGLSPHP